MNINRRTCFLILCAFHVFRSHAAFSLPPPDQRSHTLAFSPDGSLLASAHGDKVNLWSMNNRHLAQVLRVHDGGANAVAFAHDGKSLVVGTQGNVQNGHFHGGVQLWDVATHQQKATLRGHRASVDAVDFAPFDKVVVSCGGPGVRLWDANTGKLLKLLQPSTRITDVIFAPDGNSIATSDGATARLWQWRTGILKHTLNKHPVQLLSINFSPDGAYLAGCGDTIVSLWNAKSGVLKRQLKNPQGQQVHALAFSPDGKLLFGANHLSLSSWNVETGAFKKYIEVAGGYVDALAVSPDGKTLAYGVWTTLYQNDLAGGWDYEVRLHDLTTGKLTNILKD